MNFWRQRNNTRGEGAAWWTAEEENDRISMKKTNYIKSTFLSFLKVCLYGCYTNCQFYRISLFRTFHCINFEEHSSKGHLCMKNGGLYSSFLQ